MAGRLTTTGRGGLPAPATTGDNPMSEPRLNDDPSKAASDIRLTALFTAPNEERRREAAAALWESDWQRLANVEFSAEQLEAAAD